MPLILHKRSGCQIEPWAVLQGMHSNAVVTVKKCCFSTRISPQEESDEEKSSWARKRRETHRLAIKEAASPLQPIQCDRGATHQEALAFPQDQTWLLGSDKPRDANQKPNEFAVILSITAYGNPGKRGAPAKMFRSHNFLEFCACLILICSGLEHYQERKDLWSLELTLGFFWSQRCCECRAEQAGRSLCFVILWLSGRISFPGKLRHKWEYILASMAVVQLTIKCRGCDGRTLAELWFCLGLGAFFYFLLCLAQGRRVFHLAGSPELLE